MLISTDQLEIFPRKLVLTKLDLITRNVLIAIVQFRVAELYLLSNEDIITLNIKALNIETH